MMKLKKLTKAARHKLERYLILREIDSLIELHGELPNWYWEDIGRIEQNLQENFKDYSLNFFELAILLKEILDIYHTYDRIKLRKKELYPFFSAGSKELLEAIELYELHPYNIEAVVFVCKDFEKVTHDSLKDKLVRDFPEKDVKPKRLKVSGAEPIKMLLSKIGEKDKKLLQDSVAKSEKYHEGIYKNVGKHKPKTFARNIGSKALYQYLVDELASMNLKANALHILGGNILSTIKLMPSKSIPSQKEIAAFLASNFKKALKAKV